jgi:hypothetical protein
MRIPFIHRRERTIAEIAAKATRVGSAEGPGPRLGPNTRTVAENREAIERMRRIRANGGAPS